MKPEAEVTIIGRLALHRIVPSIGFNAIVAVAELFLVAGTSKKELCMMSFITSCSILIGVLRP